MTSTVFTRGAQWSASRLYDGWGDNVTVAQAQALGDLVVQRFDELAHNAGSTVFWQPATSEVIGEVVGTGPDMWREVREDGGATTPELLNEWREQATAEVWAAVIGESDDAELSAKVAEALGMGYCVGCGEMFDTQAGHWREAGNGDLCQQCTAQWEAESADEIRLQQELSTDD